MKLVTASASAADAQTGFGLEVLRDSCAHLLAMAVKELFPTAKLALGPAISDGFYYDFFMEHSLSVEELGRIEERMRQLSQEDLPIQQEMISREEALRFLQDAGEAFKLEILEQIAYDQPISIFRQGTFADLCRGPHVMHYPTHPEAFVYYSNTAIEQLIHGQTHPSGASGRNSETQSQEKSHEA